jgi:hypothetical protein
MYIQSTQQYSLWCYYYAGNGCSFRFVKKKMLTEPGLSLCQADHIMADEFSAELADGVAFVSGHDDDGRPVVVRHYCAGSLRAVILLRSAENRSW